MLAGTPTATNTKCFTKKYTMNTLLIITLTICTKFYCCICCHSNWRFYLPKPLSLVPYSYSAGMQQR